MMIITMIITKEIDKKKGKLEEIVKLDHVIRNESSPQLFTVFLKEKAEVLPLMTFGR